MVDAQECLFCKIIRGDIPSKKIYEDENTIAFLDINPATKGHTLVVGKEHSQNIFDINEEELKDITSTVKKVASALMKNLEPEGINIIQNNGQKAGQMVAHAHFHIIPRYEEDQVVIQFPREQAEENELDQVLKQLKQDGPTKNKTKEKERVQKQPQQKPGKAQNQTKQEEKPTKKESETKKAIEKDIEEMGL